jgi:hypothetical protein
MCLRKGRTEEERQGGREGGREERRATYQRRVAQSAQVGMEGTRAMKPAATVMT